MNVVEKIINDLERKHIKCVCWKGLSKIDYALEGRGDLDLFVLETSVSKAESVFRKSGWIEGIRQTFDPSIRHFYFISIDGKVFHVHCYFALRTGFFVTKEFLINIDIFNHELGNYRGIPIPSAGITTQIFLVRRSLRTKLLVRYFYFLCKEVRKFRHEERWLRQYNWWDSKASLEASECENWTPANDAKRLVELLSFLVERRVFRRKKRFPNGFVVCIDGTDGSGKSYLVKRITEVLSDDFFIRQFCFGRPNISRFSFLFFGLRAFFSTIKFVLLRLSRREGPSFIAEMCDSFARVLLAAERFIVMRSARRVANCGGLAVIDRCPTHSFGAPDGPSKQPYGFVARQSHGIEVRLYQGLSVPDLCITLVVDLDTAISRNRSRRKIFKETESEIIARHSAHLGKSRLAKRECLVDANVGQQSVLAKALSILRDEISRDR